MQFYASMSYIKGMSTYDTQSNRVWLLFFQPNRYVSIISIMLQSKISVYASPQMFITYFDTVSVCSIIVDISTFMYWLAIQADRKRKARNIKRNSYSYFLKPCSPAPFEFALSLLLIPANATYDRVIPIYIFIKKRLHECKLLNNIWEDRTVCILGPCK